MKIVTKSALMALFAGVIMPTAASAQESRLTISFTPAVAAESGDSQLALSGAAAYRFSTHFAFEGDVTWIDAAAGGFRDRSFGFDPRAGATTTAAVRTVLQSVGGMFGGRNNRLPGFPAFSPINATTEGQTWIGTMGVRYEPAVQTARFRPYVSGGLGVNFTDQTLNLAAASSAASYDDSHAGLAFSAGGGANIHLGGALWVNADAKYFHLSRDRDLMRLGGGVTFKF
jgi:outer membrane protein with beta-barrel domain